MQNKTMANEEVILFQEEEDQEIEFVAAESFNS